MQKIQGSTFSREQGSGGSVQMAQQRIGRDLIRIAQLPIDPYARIHLPEDLVKPVRAAKNRCLAACHMGRGHDIFRNQPGGDIAGTNIFRQGACHLCGNLALWYRTRMHGYSLISSSSTSKINVASGGMTPPAPRAP